MIQMLVFMGDEQANGEDAAYEFLNQHPDIWTAWVPEEAVDRIKAAIN